MLDMSVATTHRLILTLADQGYLEQEQASRSYRLTLRATELGMASINETDFASTPPAPGKAVRAHEVHGRARSARRT